MSQACVKWRGDIGAYIVGALNPGECARVRRHLRFCRACRAEYHDLVPVRDWLGSLLNDEFPTVRLPDGPPPEPVRSGWRNRRLWLVGACAVTVCAVVVAAFAVITGSPARPVAVSFQSFDRATGVYGQVRLVSTLVGTDIDLTISGLPAGERCTLIALSPTGDRIASTWSARYDGSARVEAAVAIPVSHLTALRIESPARQVLLSIPVPRRSVQSAAMRGRLPRPLRQIHPPRQSR